MNLVEELQKLEQLYQNGSLSADEFAAAKQALLKNDTRQDLNQLNREVQLSRLDREWELEQQRYMVIGRYGRQHLPTVGGGVALIVMIGLFGTFWTVTTYSMTSLTPSFGGQFDIVRLFPVFGVLFTLYGVWSGFDQISKARALETARETYFQKRRQIEQS
jgi:Short C-terminal domain